MDNGIVIIEKTDSVSWDSIHEVLWSAHESTRKDGINYPQAKLTGDEIKEFIEKNNGQCFVAMDGDKVVGTMSCHAIALKNKLFKGEYLMLDLAGNLPEYKGKGIFSGLYDACYDCAKSKNLEGIVFGTAEKNYTVRNILLKKGFIMDRCYYHKEKGRFVVGGVYCFNKLPHKRSYYIIRFKIKQIFVHLRYTNQGKKRFGI